jgi:hypothetical protein
MSETPDKFHEHEALHTAHVVMEMWDVHVQHSVWVDSHQHLAELADKAADAMMALYQAIGADHEPTS